MELKPYQKKVLKDLDTYLEYIEKRQNIHTAFNEFWRDKVGAYNSITGTGMEPYKNNIPKTPNVCLKVPTAGGKTFIAANALKTIFNHFKYDKIKFVVWLVPSITILEQTIRNLSNANHPYRKTINTHFSGKVEVYTKESLLQGAGFNKTIVQEQLSIVILSFDSLRSKKKEDRKIYQENGNLTTFVNVEEDNSYVLENTDETALVNVIRKMNPVVVVDESHNAESELSVEMLKNLNPSFVLDLTATPRKNSNIISFVNAFELKKENMVKLPVIVYNHHDKKEVIESAIQMQKKLESFAKAEEKETGKYIRPIVLLQAQPKSSDDNTTFDKIKKSLLEYKISEEQIKIKTANINEIKNIDLMDKNCPVRYIITINALKEGWDCPFAYILASLADKSSVIDVEQILGRILRQPFVSKHNTPMLNLSYVLTSSSKFQDTLKKIVDGLNKAGFSSKDYKVAEKINEEQKQKNEFLNLPFHENDTEESYSNQLVKEETTFQENESTDAIIKTAIIQNGIYENNANSFKELDNFKDHGVKVDKIIAREIFHNKIIDLKLPQFFLETGDLELFGNSRDQLLSKETLLADFTLSKCDTNIDFNEVTHELYKVDLEKNSEDDYAPKFSKITNELAASELLKFILTLAPEKRIREISNKIINEMGSMTPFPQIELFNYVQKIVADFSMDQIHDYFNRDYAYKELIKRKIRLHSEEHSEKIFNQYLDSNKIKIIDSYKIPLQQYPGQTEDYGITKSLYGKEFVMNEFERKVISDIANLDNILLWLKNPEKKGFYINGFINHYPDFIIITKKGNTLVVETKGDDRDNSDSIKKLKLGRTWANQAGKNYKYFMIFNNNHLEDAYNLLEGLKVLKGL